MAAQSSFIVPYRTTDDGLEVFWARRRHDRPFLAGHHAFIGGSVVPDDHTLGNSIDGVAPRFLACAARELFEETGILVVSSGAANLLNPDVAAMHQALRNGETFSTLLDEAGEELNSEAFWSVGQWTSEGSVVHESEFLAWELPPAIAHDELIRWLDTSEMVDGAWVRPEDALERWRRAEVVLSTPIRLVLKAFAQYPADGYFDNTTPTILERYRCVGGVYSMPLKTPTLAPATHTNCVLVGDQEQLIIVDPGSPIERENLRLAELLTQFEARGTTLLAIVLTHHHRDHTGGVAYLQNAFRLPIWAHPKTAERLPSLGVDRYLFDGDRIELGDETLVAMHTPGHADGHLALLHERLNIVIGGDLIASHGTILIDPKDGDMGAYLTSLARIRDLEASMLIPGHGWPIPNPQHRIAFYMNHRLEREEKVYQAVVLLGRTTAVDVVPIAYDDVPRKVWPLAVRSTISHLLHLTELGRLIRERDFYSAAPGKP